MMDGRVKTLHPKIHGGLLSVRDNPAHASAMEQNGIVAIDLLVSNLYPFEATVAKGAGYDEIIENIDIGGPAMIRSAAKNHAFVTVVVDPADYPEIIAALKATGGVPYPLRQRLAAKAYARTAAYDAAISTWFAQTLDFPDMPFRSFAGELREVMRYGENPHQWAAFYATGDKRPGVATATQVQGKSLSYNNLNDTDAAFELDLRVRPRDPRGRHHQARQSLRRRHRPRPRRPPTSAPSPPTRPRPSAASSPSTARSTPRSRPRS